jgi:transcriptional regulator with XRE-family HTH domain
MLITVDLFAPEKPYNRRERGERMFRLRGKEVLEQKDISQGKLSREANIPLSVVQRLCNDTRYIPNVLTLAKVARYLNVSMDDLFIYDQEKPWHAQSSIETVGGNKTTDQGKPGSKTRPAKGIITASHISPGSIPKTGNEGENRQGTTRLLRSCDGQVRF